VEHQSPLRPRWHCGIRAMLAVTAVTVGCVVLLTANLAAPTTLGVTRQPSFRVTDMYHQRIAVSRLGTPVADSQSSNWSGYNKGVLDTDTLTSSISAQWVVPTATQHTAGEAEDSATWIGIGGGCLQSSCSVTDSTLIQAGTEQDVSSSGQATYDAWYEIIPVPEIASTIVVHPGDVINCSISQVVPGVWTISLNDSTDGQSFTETVPYTSDESTAEWIEETPTEIGTSGTGLAALPNLTTVHFSRATVNGASADLQSDEALQLIDSNGNPVATPSAPVSGNGFDDCAWATTCAAP
jgi:hypothetical protein